MFPQPTTATRSAVSDTAPRLRRRETLTDERESANALGGRVAVERMVLDAHRAGVVEGEQRVDTVENLRAAFPVHAADMRARLLDVLQVHVEESLRQRTNRENGVVRLGRPPAGVDRRSEHVVGVPDRGEHLFRGLLGVVLEPESDTMVPQHRYRTVAIAVHDLADAG